MRMRFTVDDEDAFHERRDELLDEFAAWLESSQLTGAEPGYAGVAMDWKWGYQDGNLSRWTVPDLEEFLLGWCPRKLSAPPEEYPVVLRSARAFMTFLDHRGLLVRGGSTLAQLQLYCDRNAERFATEMDNPANYGLAKGLFAQAGGLEAGAELDEDSLNAVLARMSGMQAGGPGALEPMPIRTVGPITSPGPDECAKSATAAPVLDQLRQLWEFCAPPGRQLTQKGNVRLADARHLVDLLGTGDVPDGQIGEHRRSLRSAEDLPVLSWLVEIAIGARALRRHRGRLVAVAKWSELSPVEVVERLVDAAVEAGLSGRPPHDLLGLAAVQEFVDEGVGRLFAELLDARTAAEPLPIEALIELISDVVARRFGGLNVFHLSFVPEWVRTQLDRLAALGVVDLRDVKQVPTEWGGTQAHGGTAELTPAGVPVAIRLAEQLGIVVRTRPDPATATARDLITVLEHMEPEAWRADATAWVAHRDPAHAAQEIVAVLNDAELRAPLVLAALGQLGDLVGEHAVPAIRTMLTGPHDSLAMHVLLDAGAMDPAEVDPELLLRSGIDLMLAMYEIGGVDELLGVLDAANPDLLDLLWRSDHPRVAELLALIGEHHPRKSVAKAARKSLLRHRSWLSSRGQRT